jgi:two-component system nitrate/nitrite response regulator NarL
MEFAYAMGHSRTIGRDPRLEWVVERVAELGREIDGLSASERAEEGHSRRAVVADDDPVARRAICEALRGAGIVVVAEAFGGTEAVELVRYHDPDVVVIDVTVAGLDGIAATRRIREERPDQVVILLTDAANEALGVLGLRVGAAGYLRKDLDLQALTRAVVGALRGEAAIPRAMGMRLIEQMRGATASGERLRPVHSPLTARQWEVLDLLCEGRTTDEIAATLVLSSETVRSHVKDMFRRLGVRTREEAAAMACRLRGLDP